MSIDYHHWEKTLRNSVAAFDIDLTDQQIGQFYIHAEELQRWTRKTNLTAIKDADEIAAKHFIDSIVPSVYFDPMHDVLDIGSGGGFPGLPLKVLYPHIQLTLIDAVRKKTSFLKHVVRSMRIEDTQVVHGRIEEIGLRYKMTLWDSIVSRAYSSVSVILENALPLLSPGGQILIWKGPSPEEEIRAAQDVIARQRRLLTLRVRSYFLPEIAAQRTLVAIKAIDI